MEVERLARGDTIDQGIVQRAFQYSGTQIVTPAKTYNPNNEFDEEYFEFGLFMSRREYKTIRRRMRAGVTAAVKEGKWPFNQNMGVDGFSLRIRTKLRSSNLSFSSTPVLIGLASPTSADIWITGESSQGMGTPGQNVVSWES